MNQRFGYTRKVALAIRELETFTQSAIALALAAGAEILPYFRNNPITDNKQGSGTYDPVTEADRAAESLIRTRIAEEFPTHGVLGEEYGWRSGSGLTWVIDPIDGTRAFVTGMLHWGVLIALFDGEMPVLGVMHQPFTDELFIGTNVKAEYRRGQSRKALRVRSCGSLADAVLGSTGPDFFAEGAERRSFERLREQVRFTRFGGDCYLYCMVAMGQLDLVVEAGLKPYDIQALMPILRGAGGLVTTWDGGDASMGGRMLVAGDARVHAEARAVLERELERHS